MLQVISTQNSYLRLSFLFHVGWTRLQRRLFCRMINVQLGSSIYMDRRTRMSATAGPKPEAEPVKVFDTQQESEAMVVHGLLTSAGIESMVNSLEANQALWPGVGGVGVFVNPSQADEARRIIEEYNQAETDIEEVDDSEVEDIS